MKTFSEYLQNKDVVLSEVKTSDIEAMEATVKALRPIVRKYSRSTMVTVFQALCSKKGEDLLKDFVRNPSTTTLSKFRQLV